MTDMVNNPPHYTSHPSGIEAIQVTRHMNFNLGNAVKYLWRAGLKDKEKTIEDLKKAIFYINDEISRLSPLSEKGYFEPIDYFAEGEQEGQRLEQERIIALLQQDICPDWTVDCCDGACSAYNDAINLIKGEQK